MLFLFPAALRHGKSVLVLSAALVTASCSTSHDPAPVVPLPPTPPVVPAVPLPEHLTLGNPSGATADTTAYTNYLLLKPEFALSYHRAQGKPNWVSWHLTQADRGSADRQDDFRPDATLPAGWYQVKATSYVGSGFDRGHNCPSADRTATKDQNSATFVMTNMLPQAPRNNQQTWANLENFGRAQLSGGANEVYIIMGSYGKGGTGSKGFLTTLDNDHVTVPARVWKVLVILPVGENDAARVTADTRVIAVDTPNDNTISSDWSQFRVSVDALEAATGLDLLSAVAPAIQQVVEARVDNGPL
ncbi:DNA/RNA non-specific endonuclease [Hymenobacter rubripertinctus]|uniref:DNA/RNA non-specific endonuclease n=1 Tax=Hymenobacter rubripertinctus TaxID=2029981 RepID=A0A418R8N9_9BACT|nr:DNA/RNA non-specific endonuclease [Hymenobacter rubripertinctus]RIY13739.1 DNA/RNA non-specific endonuclease [Hymenobacter rubripertinctus]